MIKKRNRCRAPLTVAWLLLTAVGAAQATNPFVTTEYNADPSARVFGNRLYVYPTDDTITVPATNFQYHCYSTDDMANWQDHGVIFNVSMSKWAQSSLWAPDCINANGQYYLYYPSRDASNTFYTGVAVSPTPTGPFVDTGAPIAATQGGIDPNVFIDDNGQAYLYWAAGGPKVTALSSDMIHTTGPVISPTGCDNFFEGPWMFKRNGVYYMTYAAFLPGGSGLGGNGQNFDYATSSSPTGPFTYRGHFSRTSPTQPEANNIHGSQVLWNGTWYCFYHDFQMSERYPTPLPDRCVDVDLLNFAADGSIEPLVWTSTGPPAIKNLNPYLVCEAETLNQTDYPAGPHAVTTEPCSEGTLDVGSIDNGDWLGYANADFGPSPGASQFSARVASPVGGCSLEVHLNSITGPLLGSVSIPNTGGWQTWQTVTCPVTGAVGVHNIYLVAVGGSGDLFNINWYKFTQANPTIPDGVYRIAARTTGNVLDCTGCSNADGTPIQEWPYWGGVCQTWVVHNLGGGAVSIRNLNPDGTVGKSLDCTGCSPSDLTKIDLWDYWGGPCQQWIPTRQADGYFSIATSQTKADGTHDVLDGSGCSGLAGTPVILWSWDGGGCQQEWDFIPVQASPLVDGGTYTLSNEAAGLNLDNPNGSNVPGSRVQLWPANGATAQNWTLHVQAGGAFSLTNQAGGLNLDDPGGGNTWGTLLDQWSSNGATAQAWQFQPLADGSYSLLNVAAALCLDNPSGSTAPNTILQLWPGNGSPAQGWRLTPQ